MSSSTFEEPLHFTDPNFLDSSHRLLSHPSLQLFLSLRLKGECVGRLPIFIAGRVVFIQDMGQVY